MVKLYTGYGIVDNDIGNGIFFNYRQLFERLMELNLSEWHPSNKRLRGKDFLRYFFMEKQRVVLKAESMEICWQPHKHTAFTPHGLQPC